jgi:hypothetical protein
MDDEVGRRTLAMEDRAVGFITIPLARYTLKLPPGLTTGMAVGADIAQAEPAAIGTIRIGTEMPRRIDGALAASVEEDQWRWRAWGFRTRIDAVLTSLTQGLLEISGKGFGFF